MLGRFSLFALALIATTLGTGVVRYIARRHGLIDQPGHRSSHSIPTPRGGGVAMVIVVLVIGISLWSAANRDAAFSVQRILMPAALIAILGFVDDKVGLSASVRLVVQMFVALLFAVLLPESSGFPSWAFVPAVILAVLGMMWGTNLYNFMDGIDGIAASQAVFMALAAAWILDGNVERSIIDLLVAVAGSSVGFLAWNWQPARIFMGDVGSAFLGFVFSAVAILDLWSRPAAIWMWLILGGTFLADATVTLLVRLLHAEPIAQAHRSHAYQRLARRWSSHARVTCSYSLVNLFWLLPLAKAANSMPDRGAYMAAVALAPLVIIALAAGAGNRESPAQDRRA